MYITLITPKWCVMCVRDGRTHPDGAEELEELVEEEELRAAGPQDLVRLGARHAPALRRVARVEGDDPPPRKVLTRGGFRCNLEGVVSFRRLPGLIGAIQFKPFLIRPRDR